MERGTHGELLEHGGVYAALWDRQREVDEARETLERTLTPEEAAKEKLGACCAAGVDPGLCIAPLCACRPLDAGGLGVTTPISCC